MILQHKPRRGKRSIHAFAPDRNDNTKLWPSGTRWAVSFLCPQVAAAKALGLLNKVGCCLAQQTNATSLALAGLLSDVGSVRHATLQNRAAIDFLLLAHGHGCEDFDGMCSINLSDHSKSIHAHTKELQTSVSTLREESESDWLNSLFGNWQIAGWVKNLLKIGCLILLVMFCILLNVPCLLSFLQRALQKSINAAFVIQKKGAPDETDSWTDYLTESHLKPVSRIFL